MHTHPCLPPDSRLPRMRSCRTHAQGGRDEASLTCAHALTRLRGSSDCFDICAHVRTVVTGGVAAQAHHAGEVAHRHEHARGGGAHGRGARSSHAGLHAMLHYLRCTPNAHPRLCTHTHTHIHIPVHTHVHTQAPLAANESEAADKPRCLTSQRDAEAQVCMRLRMCTHTHAHAPARAYALALAHVHVHVHIYMGMDMHMYMYLHM